MKVNSSLKIFIEKNTTILQIIKKYTYDSRMYGNLLKITSK